MTIQINKHGLSRTVPPEIKAQIRKTDGYGCIKCGNIFIQYEHIDPLFCNAVEHNPKNMTLLCTGCHNESTGKRLPKRIIQKLKDDPYCKKKGRTHSNKFYPNPDHMIIEIGSSTFSNTDIAIILNGKPIIWVSKSFSDPFSPLLYNGIFMDSVGNKIGYLNKNQFIGLIGDCDFQAISSRIEVRRKKREINLILEIEGDNIVKIKKMFFKYQHTQIKLKEDKKIYLTYSNNDISISNLTTEKCFRGLSIGDIPFLKSKYNKTFTSMLFVKSQKVNDIFGKHSGFLMDDKFYNLEYKMVGVIKNTKVYNLFDEYIGNLFKKNESQIHIVMENDEYPDQEPIWVSQKNQKIFFFQSSILIDTSYRLFGFN